MSIAIYKVDLSGHERVLYSKELQEFESQFSYPLGQKRFNIVHGASDGCDYFSFFEQMGEVYYFVARNEEKIVGAGCAVLRDGLEGTYWYLCDFKILKEYRGKGILEKMFKKYFIPCVIKSRKMMAVNMGDGSVSKNGLLSKLKRVFWMFNVQVKSLNFHTWTKDTVPRELSVCYGNNGKKDLMIDGKSLPLYHVNKEKIYDDMEFKGFDVDKLDSDVQLMACFEKDSDPYVDNISGSGIFISIGLNTTKVSTVEI